MKFYAMMAVKRSALDIKGEGLNLVRFLAKGGKKARIISTVKTFIYWHPVKQSFDVCETLCGMMIGTGPTEEKAIADTKDFFKNSNAKMFFVQAAAMGPSRKRPEISWDQAMKHQAAGHHVQTIGGNNGGIA